MLLSLLLLGLETQTMVSSHFVSIRGGSKDVVVGHSPCAWYLPLGIICLEDVFFGVFFFSVTTPFDFDMGSFISLMASVAFFNCFTSFATFSYRILNSFLIMEFPLSRLEGEIV